MLQSKAKLIFKKAITVYQKHLLLSNTLSTMALLGTGDIIAQCIEAKLRLADKMSAQSSLFTLKGLDSAAHRFSNPFTQEALKGIPSCLTSLMPIRQPGEKHLVTLFAGRGYIAKERAPVPAKKEPSIFDEIDYKRSARIALIGLVMGPFGHFWFQVLEKMLPARTLACVLLKVAMDQIISAPLLNVFYIFGSHGLDGMALGDIVAVFKEKFPMIYMYDCGMWPVAQLMNFLFVPAMYRLLYVNALSLVWNSILSFLLFEKQNRDGEEMDLSNVE